MLLESIIQGLIANTEFVILVAFLLGVLTSISPCPLATNIAAIAYISRDIKDPRHTPLSGLAYTLGRIVTYSVLGVGILVIGMNVIDLSLTVQRIHGEILGMIMIAAGLFMVGLGHFDFTLGTGGRLTEKLSRKAADYGLLGAFLIGVVFALAFCPYSAVLFFSGLIPLGLASESGVILPAFYGLGTGIPVIIFSILFYLGVQELNRHVQNVQKIERALRKAIGVVFVVIGLYYSSGSWHRTTFFTSGCVPECSERLLLNITSLFCCQSCDLTLHAEMTNKSEKFIYENKFGSTR